MSKPRIQKPRYHRVIDQGKYCVAEDGIVIFEATNEAEQMRYLAALQRSVEQRSR